MVLSQMKLTPVWVEKESVTEGLLMDVTSLVAREVFAFSRDGDCPTATLLSTPFPAISGEWEEERTIGGEERSW